jgi:hypothetical protein
MVPLCHKLDGASQVKKGNLPDTLQPGLEEHKNQFIPFGISVMVEKCCFDDFSRQQPGFMNK